MFVHNARVAEDNNIECFDIEKAGKVAGYRCPDFGVVTPVWSGSRQ